MDFLQNINIDQLADIGFGLLVAGICIKTLFSDKNVLKKQRELWKHELSELENSLKSLISEASDASEVFDKNIRHRQRELTVLLEKIEQTITEAKSCNATPVSTASQSTVVDDPPWVIHESEQMTVADKVHNSLKNAAKGTSLKDDSLSSLENTGSREQDPDRAVSLKQKIEIERQEQEKYDHEIFQQTSIVDPVAFRIAKRLLLEGKELHIVARKLELPVSEIRHLDALLRERAQKQNRPLPKALAEKEIRRVRGIVRGTLHKSSSTASSSDTRSDQTITEKKSQELITDGSELF